MPDRERLFESHHGRSPDGLHAAVVAAGRRPHDAAHLATAAPKFVVECAARDCAVSVNDQAARTGHEIRP
jgi:hypothetical protein